MKNTRTASVSVLPPIYRDCQRLLRHTEAVVMRFSSYHKYTVGADLRRQAFTMMRTVHRAVYDRDNQAQHIHALVWQVDDYKLTLQLAMDIGAFIQRKAGTDTAKSSAKASASKSSDGFSAFETAALLAAAIGKQCGGWLKKFQPATTLHTTPGQSPVATREGVQQVRPTSLSTRAASFAHTGLEATP